MNKSAQAQPRLSQDHLATICYQRLTAPDFAQKPSIRTRLISWIKGGAA